VLPSTQFLKNTGYNTAVLNVLWGIPDENEISRSQPIKHKFITLLNTRSINNSVPNYYRLYLGASSTFAVRKNTPNQS
jgi:hypothetical protein